jgi:hypothetical protein
MREKVIPPDSWRLDLLRKAKAIAAKAEAEGRTQFTPEEEVQLDLIMQEYHAALTVEKLIIDEGEDEGTV